MAVIEGTNLYKNMKLFQGVSLSPSIYRFIAVAVTPTPADEAGPSESNFVKQSEHIDYVISYFY